MSKFTKALEKIQDDRDSQRAGIPRNGRTTAPVSPEIKPNGHSWSHSLGSPKNLSPDNKVVTLRFPDSVIAEQYRMLRTSLKNKLAKENAKVILVSSSLHSEGKTLSSVNLAVSLAENGDAKVALIDADLRRGKVAEYLGLDKKKPGLSNLLMHDLNPKQVMLKAYLDNLSVLTRGEIVKKPSELISSHKFQMLVTELRAHFDYIIIDAPPIMSVADAGIMAKESDGVLFIIQIGRTPKTVIAHSNQLFRQSGCKMLGYVLTNVEFQSSDYRYYQYYYYDEKMDNGKGFKRKTQEHFKKAGWGFKKLEDRFNSWWDHRVLKTAKQEAAPEAVPAGTDHPQS